MDEGVEIARGKHAVTILEDSLLIEALEAISMKYENAWVNSQPAQVEVREKAFLMLHVVKEFKGYLTRIIETGKLAGTAQLERIEMSERQQRIDAWDGSPDSGPT